VNDLCPHCGDPTGYHVYIGETTCDRLDPAPERDYAAELTDRAEGDLGDWVYEGSDDDDEG